MAVMDFMEPLTAPYLYAAWSVQPRLIGPVVAPSAERRRVAGQLVAVTRSLASDGDTQHVRLLRAGSIPPLRGRPRFDLALLVRGGTDLEARLEREFDAVDAPRPELVTTAVN